jgi:hypothetical protein
VDPSSLPLTIKVVRPHYKVIGPSIMDSYGGGYDADHGPSAEALRQDLWFRLQEREATKLAVGFKPRVHRLRKIR